MFPAVQCAHLHQLKWSGLWPEAMLALQTHNLALFRTLQHSQFVLLWDFWISILNVCTRVWDFTAIWSHVFCAYIVQSCKYKTEGNSVLEVLLQSWCYLFKNLGGSVQPSFFLLCETGVPLCTLTFGDRNVFLLKAIRMGWDPVALLV